MRGKFETPDGNAFGFYYPEFGIDVALVKVQPTDRMNVVPYAPCQPVDGVLAISPPIAKAGAQTGMSTGILQSAHESRGDR